jgi:hypothetical protein
MGVGNYDKEKRQRHNEVVVPLRTKREKGLNKDICVEANHP